MNREDILDLRRHKDIAFRTSPDSPLTAEQKDSFAGLTYYDYDPALALTVTVEPVNDDALLPVMTTTNEIRNYRRYGTFTFSVEGEETQLTIYETPHGFFLPFVDASAGTETYPAGRYLDLEPLDEAARQFHVDFNLAYNPFCAYNAAYSCPITPAENRLNVAIRAGEKLPDFV